MGLVGSGCLEIPTFPTPSDAALVDAYALGRPSVTSVIALSEDARVWPTSNIPRQPRLALLWSAALDRDAPVFLLEGAADAELLSDLALSPLRADTLARVIDAEVSATGSRIDVVPRAPLAPGATLVLVVAAWARSEGRALGEPFALPLTVSTDPALGARATEAWPPDGASGVGPAVPLFGVRFDGDVELGPGTLALFAGDTPVPAFVRGATCAEVGWSGPACAVLLPLGPLAPSTRHELRLGVVLDATGAELPPFSAFVTTGLEEDETPPSFATLECAPDETALEIGCAAVDDRSISIRVRATEPLRVTLDTPEGRTRSVFPRGEGAIGVRGLAPDSPFDAVFSATDASGLASRVPLLLRTTELLAEIGIVEVRADPFGREPTQEYVELFNGGSVSIDIDGMTLSDALLSDGDVLPPLRVPPGGRVLIVASSFDPDDTADAPVPPGVPLARVDASLGVGGLTSYGEALYLRDAAGHRLSTAPAMPAREGVCVVRVAIDLRTGALSAFGYDPAGTCSPGTD